MDTVEIHRMEPPLPLDPGGKWRWSEIFDTVKIDDLMGTIDNPIPSDTNTNTFDIPDMVTYGWQ